MHTRKLAKFGKSNYVLLDKTILALSGMASRDEVQISVEKGKIVITPVKEKAK